MRIGILLGSFDPIHIGHTEIAIRALNNKEADVVYFIPAKKNPWKDKQTPYWDRYRLVHDVVEEFGGGDDKKSGIQVSDIEARLEDDDTFSYIVLDLFSKQMELVYPGEELEFYIICGTDVAKDICRWKEGKWILDNYKLLVYDRLGIDISSTKVREMIKTGKCPLPWITGTNYKYIIDHELYK